MFGGNINPARGRTADSEHGGARSGTSLKDNKPSGRGNGDPEPEAEGIEDKGGDGFHHHELSENESGLHSKHTHPDGRVEHADHGDYNEAKDHQDRLMAHQDMGADDGGEEPIGHNSDADDQPDFSAAYCRD
jgi:hypothetical protein